MPTFGFSAFLKLVSLNQRPQRTLVKQRLAPNGSQGYDFHRSLKLRINRYLVEAVSLADVLSTVDQIGRAPERKSARSGLIQLGEWRALNPGKILSFGPAAFESPAKNFKVNYTPNFGIELGGRRVAVHVWNTANPPLDIRLMYAVLSLFPEIYSVQGDRPDDVAVLSLPQSRLYRLSDVSDQSEMASRLVRRLDDLFEEVRLNPDVPKSPKPLPPQPPRPA